MHPDGPQVVQGPRPLTERGLQSRRPHAAPRLREPLSPERSGRRGGLGRLAIDGIRRVEPCDGPEKLAAALEVLLRPVAPTVQVFPPERSASRRISRGGQGRRPQGRLLAPSRGQPRGAAAARHSLDLYERAHFRPGSRAWSPGSSTRPTSGPELSRVCLCGSISMRPAPCRTGRCRRAGRPGRSPPPDDRSTRLTAVAFAGAPPSTSTPTRCRRYRLAARLATALSAAATDTGEREFLRTLERLVAALHDGHGGELQPVRCAVLGATAARLGPRRGQARDNRLARRGGRGRSRGTWCWRSMVGRPRVLFPSSAPSFRAPPREDAVSSRPAPPAGTANSIVRLEVERERGAARRRARASPWTGARARHGRRSLRSWSPASTISISTGPPSTISRPRCRSSPQQERPSSTCGGTRACTHTCRTDAETLRSANWQVPIVTRPDRLGTIDYNIAGRWVLPPRSPSCRGASSS